MISWTIIIAAIWLTAFYRVRPLIWIPGFAILLYILSAFLGFSFLLSSIVWFVLVASSVFFLIEPLRRKYLTIPLIHWFHRQQPKLARVEQEVLDAGGLWFEKEFFTGMPDWKKLLSYPKPELTEEERDFLEHKVGALCELLDDWKMVHEDKDLSKAAWDFIKREKFLGLCIEKKYNGLAFSPLMHSAVVAKIASRSHSAAITVMVPNSLGPAEFIHCFGTEAQKNYYLPRLAIGEEIPCFALTGLGAGSDATSIVDNGIVCKGEFEGKEIIGIRLNWEKRYITLAPVATLIGLAFKLYDPDHLLGSKKNIGISLALIPATHPGVEIGARHYPLNLAFMNGPIRGKDVFIPLDWLIGGAETRGHGWKMMMECLSIGRGISLPALATATLQLSFRMTGAYAHIRQQFQRPIGEFEGVQEGLARIAGFAYIAESARIFTAQAVGLQVKPAVASAIIKYHLTEMARKGLAHAMDIHGGRGIQMGPKNYLGNVHDGMPTSITVEGANILTRNLIIFGQGALRCHPYLRDEIANADTTDPLKMKKFEQLFLRHIGLSLRNFARSFWYGLTLGLGARVPKTKKLNWHFRQLTRLSAVFAFSSDLTLAIFGKKLKIRESISARLGDVMSHLYLSSAVLKHFYDEGEPDDQLIYVDWTSRYCFYQIYRVLQLVFENYPSPWFGRLILWFCFPFSKGYRYPQDSLSFQLADSMRQNLTLREVLTPICYIGKTERDPLAIIERAFLAQIEAEPILSKLRKTQLKKEAIEGLSIAEMAKNAYNEGVISVAEQNQLIALDELLRDAVAVDEFKK
jgi:acyl-CoA dehydrogenase